MQSPKVAIVKAITLLTLEKRLEGELSTDVVKELIEHIPSVDDNSISDLEKEAYYDTYSLMCELARTPKEDFPHEEDILQRCKLACKNDQSLYDALFDVLDNDKYKDEQEAAALANSTRRTLDYIIKDINAYKVLDKFNMDVRFKRGAVNLAKEFDRLCTEMEPYIKRTDSNGPDESMIIDFSNVDSIERIFEISNQKATKDGILRTGWQGMNRMLGEAGGFKRGEDAIFSALPYSYKSGAVLNLFAQLPYFNKPFLFDKSKKPCFLFITLENDLDNNIRILYKTIYENIHKVKLDLSTISVKEAAKEVNEFFAINGWTCFMCKFTGQDLTANRVISWLRNLSRQGYEIAALFIDYLALMSKEGIYFTFTGQDLTLLYQKIANYTRDNFITLITPHQLSTQAVEIKREQGENFAERVSGKGFYDGSKRLAQEPSLEVTIDKIERRDADYLIMVRGKHRTEFNTPSKHRKWAMKFQEVGTLPWDVDGEDLTVDLNDDSFDSDFTPDSEDGF